MMVFAQFGQIWDFEYYKVRVNKSQTGQIVVKSEKTDAGDALVTQKRVQGRIQIAKGSRLLKRVRECEPGRERYNHVLVTFDCDY
jgi:hypothetical protein